MNSVKRGEIPKILKEYGCSWTDELQAQLRLYGIISNVPKKYINHYKHPDIKDALIDMYGHFCCYCQSPIGKQTYEHIEHLKPKSLFPDECFEWSNLHLSCQICNVSYKKDKWDVDAPILSPTLDIIEDYLTVNLNTAEIIAIDGNKRALTTINHTGLNREGLIEARLKLIVYMKKLMEIGQGEQLRELLEMQVETAGHKIVCQSFLKLLDG